MGLVRNKNKYDKILFLVVILSFLLMVITSSDPIWPLFRNTFFERILITELNKYTTLYNLSLGIVVSYIFYLIVAYFPHKNEKKLLKDSLCGHVKTMMSMIIPQGDKGERYNYEEFLINTRKIISDIENKDGLTSLNRMTVKSYSSSKISAFESLMPVAAEISSNHLFYWSAAIDMLRGIHETEDPNDIDRFFGYHLIWIESFYNEAV